MQKDEPAALVPPSIRSKTWKGTLAIWLCAAVVVLPLLVRGPSCGADFLFHFTSWHDALNSWRHLIPYPHWSSSASFGAGEPRFIFYPPLTWMLGAALGWWLPWAYVPTAMDFLFLGLTGLATRGLARLFLSEAGATLAGATAIFSGYGLYEIYFHGDFALLTGGFWIPLLLLLVLRGRSASPSLPGRVLDNGTLPLALVIAGSWLCNAPLGLMACYLAATLALIAAVQTRSWIPLARTLIPVALGLGLIGFYLVPAAAEQHWIDIQKLFIAPEHVIQNRWITFELMGPPHGLYPSQRARGVIEALMLLMALGGMAVVWRRGLWPRKDFLASNHRWFALAVVPPAILFLMFPVSLPVWNLLPRLRYLEYPWRWLVVLQAPMAIFFAAAVWPTRRRLRPFAVAACAAVFLLAEFGASTNRHLFLACNAASSDPNSIAAMDGALQPDGAGVGGADEYSTPPGARDDLIATHLPDACLVRDPSLLLSTVPSPRVPAFYIPRAWSPALGTCEATFTATTGADQSERLHLTAEVAHPGYLILRLRSYPAWRIIENGRRVRDLPRRADGLIAVPVAQGPVDLTVNWITTPDVLLGRGLSAVSVLLAMSLWWLVRTRASPEQRSGMRSSAQHSTTTGQ